MSMGAMQWTASTDDAGQRKVHDVTTGYSCRRETEGHRLTHGREGKAEHVGHIQGDPQVGCWKTEECLRSHFCCVSQGKTCRLRVRGGKQCWMFEGKGDSVKCCLRVGMDGPGESGGRRSPLELRAHPFLLTLPPLSLCSRVVPCSGARVSQGQLHFPSGDFALVSWQDGGCEQGKRNSEAVSWSMYWRSRQRQRPV